MNILTIYPGTGNSTGYPPNGGGGGLGYAANITFSDFVLYNNTGVYAVTQCTSYNGASGGCDSAMWLVQSSAQLLLPAPEWRSLVLISSTLSTVLPLVSTCVTMCHRLDSIALVRRGRRTADRQLDHYIVSHKVNIFCNPNL
jgi:hypothetical protein